MVVEAVSKSKFWKETAIFVIEDDAQNGPDHVDAHRSCRAGDQPVHEAQVRRFDDVLDEQHAADDGTDPRPEADEPVRRGGPADVPLVPGEAGPDAVQARRAGGGPEREEQDGRLGAALSEKFDLAKEDAADDLLFNEVIWRSVKGANSPMPAPVRAGFFVPKVKARE